MTDGPDERAMKEMQRLKTYFPFRIVYGARDPSNGFWLTSATTTMRRPNSLARKGWKVVIFG